MPEVISIRRPMPDPVHSHLFQPEEKINDLIASGDDLTHTVRYREDKWNLAGHRAWPVKNGQQCFINFANIDSHWRNCAKDLALLQMRPQLAWERAPEVPLAQAWREVQEAISPVTSQGNIKALGHALAVIDQQQIRHFDSETWERIVNLLIQPANKEHKRDGATLSFATGRMRANQIIALWQVSHIGDNPTLLGHDRPFDGRETAEMYVRKNKGNAVRPHEAVGSVLGFAAWVFDNIAEDIVTHIEWWASNTSQEPPATKHDLYEAMLELADDLAGKNNGILPGTVPNGGTRVTLAGAGLGRLLGVADADLSYEASRWVVAQLKDRVAYSTDVSPCPLPISCVMDANGAHVPWVPRLIASASSLDIWQRRLVYLAMFYISSTTLLRDSQISIIPMDCVSEKEIKRPNGITYTRYSLHTFKTKNRHAPIPTTVTVNARIYRIITLLQRLQAALGYEPDLHRATGLPFLFDQRLATGLGKMPRVDSRESLHLDLSFMKVVKDAAGELRRRGMIPRDLDDVKINMRQVRITAAQAYAVREHGQALAAAFGQWDSRAVAAGYIGDVYELIAPHDRDELIDLIAEEKGRRLTKAASEVDSMTGNGQKRLSETLATNKKILANPAPLSPARLRSLGKQVRNIEQGPLTLCLYQDEGAMCGGRGKPDFRLCFPGQCRNSVMSLADRARYELMRRQHLLLHSEVLRRAADKMDDANPEIKEEFQDVADASLQDIIKVDMDAYIAQALEA